MKSLGLLGLVFDTGLSVTPLMGHLGCLASHWSVPVGWQVCRGLQACLFCLSPVSFTHPAPPPTHTYTHQALCAIDTGLWQSKHTSCQVFMILNHKHWTPVTSKDDWGNDCNCKLTASLGQYDGITLKLGPPVHHHQFLLKIKIEGKSVYSLSFVGFRNFA